MRDASIFLRNHRVRLRLQFPCCFYSFKSPGRGGRSRPSRLKRPWQGEISWGHCLNVHVDQNSVLWRPLDHLVVASVEAVASLRVQVYFYSSTVRHLFYSFKNTHTRVHCLQWKHTKHKITHPKSSSRAILLLCLVTFSSILVRKLK